MALTDLQKHVMRCLAANRSETSYVSLNGEETMIQWMSETKRRFFPLVHDEEWGARLHQADLAVNKVLAAASRTKARDFVDLVCIEERMCPLILAAAGKPPHFSPQKIVDEIRRRGLSVATEDYDSVKGIPKDWNASYVRGRLSAALDCAESYLKSAPSDIVGVLAVDGDGKPVAVVSLDEVAARGIELRRPTEEPEVMPEPADAACNWANTGR